MPILWKILMQTISAGKGRMMESSEFISLVNFLQTTTVGIALFGYIPQWLVVWRTGTARGLSLQSWSLWLFSGVITWSYAYIHFRTFGNTSVLLFTSSFVLVANIITVLIILHYNRSEKNASLIYSRSGPSGEGQELKFRRIKRLTRAGQLLNGLPPRFGRQAPFTLIRCGRPLPRRLSKKGNSHRIAS